MGLLTTGSCVLAHLRLTAGCGGLAVAAPGGGRRLLGRRGCPDAAGGGRGAGWGGGHTRRTILGARRDTELVEQLRLALAYDARDPQEITQPGSQLRPGLI